MFPIGTMTAVEKDVKLKDREFKLSPFRLKEFAYMQNWFIEAPLELCKKELDKFGHMYDEKRKRRIVEKYHNEYMQRLEIINGQDIDIDLKQKIKDDMNREYSSLEGITRMLWLSIKRTEPDITLEEIEDIVDLGSLVEIKSILDALMFAPKPENPEKKTETDGER